ncbi:MAG: (d)CMP kinase [Verrucomicrobiota bacterium]|jgi:cytidylate kinase
MLERVITIDGGAATGKSTAMVRLSQHLGWRGISTGHVYRAATMLAMAEGVGPADAAEKLAARLRAGALDYDVSAQAYGLRGPDGTMRLLDVAELTSPEVSALTPQYSRVPEVRAALLEFQRGMFSEPGLVADGRDCGTVVFPRAALKVWLEVDPVEAARRLERGLGMTFAAAYADVLERNLADRSRSNPMRPADDALVMDTTRLTPDEVLRVLVELGRRRGLVRGS